MGQAIRIAMLGDKYRYQYLRHLLDDPSVKQDLRTETLMKQSVYIVSPGWNHDVVMKAGDVLFTSPQVPLYTVVFFPNEAINEQFQEDTFTAVDRFVIFDENPYHQDSLVATIKKISNCAGLKDLEIVLPRSETSGLKTDITTETDAVKEAKEFYRKLGYPARTTSLAEASGLLLYPLESHLDMTFQRVMKGRIEEAEEKIQTFLDMDYDFTLALNDSHFSVDRINSFSAYESFMSGDVWSIFWKRAEDYYFKGKGRELFQEVITAAAQCIAGGAEVKREEEELSEQIYREFMSKKNLYHVEYNMAKGTSEKAYEQKLQATHIDTEFARQLDDFIKIEMKEICKYYLISKINTWKGMMKYGK